MVKVLYADAACGHNPKLWCCSVTLHCPSCRTCCVLPSAAAAATCSQLLCSAEASGTYHLQGHARQVGQDAGLEASDYQEKVRISYLCVCTFCKACEADPLAILVQCCMWPSLSDLLLVSGGLVLMSACLVAAWIHVMTSSTYANNGVELTVLGCFC